MMLFCKPDELYCNQDLTLMAIMIIKPSQSGPAKFILLKSQLTLLYFLSISRNNTQPPIQTVHVSQWAQWTLFVF